MPVGAGRAENVLLALGSIEEQSEPVDAVVVVFDGEDAICDLPEMSVPVIRWVTRKHQPGMEQPRNIGVHVLQRKFADRDRGYESITHAWFLDSDVVVGPDAHVAIREARVASPEPPSSARVICCPYDWLPPGERPEPVMTEDWIDRVSTMRSDPRWPSFDQYDASVSRRNDLAAGLAGFSGNLVWPIDQFERVGGFWNDLNHGRCEDGELGLRAVAMGVPIGFAREARGWHLYHEVNMQLALERNTRDVPMLNARHPWVEGSDVFVVEEDGKRFNVRCGECGWEGNTAEWWAHASGCSGDLTIPVSREEFNF